MDKGLNVPKWVLINWPKIPQMPQNLSAHSIAMGNLNNSKETTPTTTTALKVAP